MVVMHTDKQVDAFVEERKPLPANWQHRTRWRAKCGQDGRYPDVNGEKGTEFRLILRRTRVNGVDYSIILAVLVRRAAQVFRLRRYNGRSHEHTNEIENGTLCDFTFMSRRSCCRAARGQRLFRGGWREDGATGRTA